jgi:hypothetical protein
MLLLAARDELRIVGSAREMMTGSVSSRVAPFDSIVVVVRFVI